MQDRNTEDHLERLENAGPKNAGLDSEGPFRRNNGLVCSEVVQLNVIQHICCGGQKLIRHRRRRRELRVLIHIMSVGRRSERE